MQSFIYPATLTADKEDGDFVVTFVDLPEAITTQEENVEDALSEAADCLDEAIANRIASDLPIPDSSQAKKGEYAILLPVQLSAKAALYLAIRDAKITKVELARRMNCDEKEVRRLLNPKHPSKLPRIEQALATLGKQLVVGLYEAA